MSPIDKFDKGYNRYKNVLFVIPSLSYGGAELLMIQQVQWLQANGWSISVAILSKLNDRDLIESLAIPEERLLIIDSPYSVLSNASIYFAIKKKHVIRDFAKSNYVHTIVAHLPLAHLWGRLSKLYLPKIKLIVYHHSMQYEANPLNTFFKKIFNEVQKVLAHKTDNISICISESVKTNIDRNFILVNPKVLYNSVTDKLPEMGVLNRNNQKLSEEKLIKLIIPGRLHPAKGHLFFLHVYKKLLKGVSKNIDLLIAGGGQLEDEIKSFIHLHHLEDKVTLTGYISNKKLLEFIYQSDIVIIPSISEGLGIVAIEALMLGKTIIASDTGGLKEVVFHQQNGYLFKAKDNENCFEVCKNVLSVFPNSLFSPVSLRDDYLKRFSFESHIEKLILLL